MSTSTKTNVHKVKGNTSKYNLYLSILSLLKTKKPTDICSDLGIKKQALNYHLKWLKDNRYIEKIGYGVWKIIKEEVQKVDLERSKSMSKIRSHGFGFYLKIPKIPLWSKRDEFLKKENIQFKKDNFEQGQQIDFKGYHIFLYKNGIRFLQKEGFEGIFTNSATLGNEIATRHMISVIKGLERLFGVSLTMEKFYQLKITRQHHAMIKNELANLYNKQGQKLQVYDTKGLWLLIDGSFNLDELECVRGSTANKDMDNAVLPLFNDLKEIYEKTGEPVKLSQINQALNTLFLNQNEIGKVYGENINKHLATLDEMQKTQVKLQETMQKIEEKMR